MTGSHTTRRRVQAVGLQLLIAAVLAATVIVSAPASDAQATPQDTAEPVRGREAVKAKVDAPYPPKAGTVFNNPSRVAQEEARDHHPDRSGHRQLRQGVDDPDGDVPVRPEQHR